MRWLGEGVSGSVPGAEERHTTDVIEEELYRQRQDLFGELSVASFDTTSLYFEEARGQTLGQQGRSKDYQPHLKQVILGMVLDGSDRPFALFLWPGNTADVTRLIPVVTRLRTRFGIGKVRVVADRGRSVRPRLQLSAEYRLHGRASAPRPRFATRCSMVTASRCRCAFGARKAQPSSPSKTLPLADDAMCYPPMQRKPERMPRPRRDHRLPRAQACTKRQGVAVPSASPCHRSSRSCKNHQSTLIAVVPKTRGDR